MTKRSLLSLIVGLYCSCSPLAVPAVANAEEVAKIAPTVPQAPARAPNVIVILADDVGFAMNSTFGGPVPTPNGDALSKQGLRYNTFHTTAQCSPTRAALLTGRNPHRVGMGGIADIASADPGYTTILPKSAATIGSVMHANGYATAWIGKGHVTPQWEVTAAGPFDRWPTGLGFDYYYGFMSGETDQFHPSLYENTKPVPTPDQPGYILDRDLMDHSIGWIRQQKSIAPSRPFFLYLATGAVHAPQEALPEWIARFHGKFDQGWDKLREETFARQKREGIIPANARLTPRPASVPAWTSLSADERRVASRLMEVAAAQSAYFDDQLGRLFATLKQDGLWDNTLIMYVNGDNGATQVGGPLGSPLFGMGPGRTLERALGKLDEMGSDKEPTNYNVGWAWAMNAPFPYWKQMSGHLGGIRNGLTVSWPHHVPDPGAIRSQFGFVTDIAPTIYEATGARMPEQVDGVAQMPLDGVSMVYSFTSPSAPSRHTTQYFEINGNRGIYKDGWFAGTTPPPQIWEGKPGIPVMSRNWELYNLSEDYAQSRDLAKAQPAKLEAMRAAFDDAAKANGFQLRDVPERRPERSAVQPYWSNGRNHFDFYPSQDRLTEQSFPILLGRKWSVKVKLGVDNAKASGTLISQGYPTTGWSLSLVAGHPTLTYAAEPFEPVIYQSDATVPSGDHVVQLVMEPESADRFGPIKASIMIDAVVAGEFRIDHPMSYMSPAGIGLGRNFSAPLPPKSSGPAFPFSGTIDIISVDVLQSRPSGRP